MFSNNKKCSKYKPQKVSHPSHFNMRKPYKCPLSVQQKLKKNNKSIYLYGRGRNAIDVTSVVYNYMTAGSIVDCTRGSSRVTWIPMVDILRDELDTMSRLHFQINDFINKCQQYRQFVTLILFCRKYHNILKKLDKVCPD